jgi:Ca2+-binding RTX toxin-like protein
MAKFVGTNGNDSKIGLSEPDLMFGLLGDDTLDGSGGRDTLDGGGGNDKLFGGSSNDSLLGGVGDDTLEGGTFHDTLMGGGGNDSLLGDDGFDSLDGGIGNDTMNGGAGIDFYVVDSVLDSANDSGTEGGDLVQATVSVDLATGPFAGIEHVTLLGKANIDATGNGVGNHLIGNGGANKLDGGVGVDTLEGGAGKDSLIGGAGNDTYTIDALDTIDEAGGGLNDRARGAFAIDLSKFTGIEHATLTGIAALAVTGDAGNNMLVGNGGANTLTGGLGADTLIGGAGNDVYNVEGADVIIEYAGGGTDQVNSAVDFSLAGLGVENLLLTGAGLLSGTGNELANKITGNAGISNLVGGAGNDTLLGNDGGDNLNGGTGDDSLVGGDGSDSYIVDDLGDKVTENGTKDSAADQLISSINHALGANIEQLFLVGADDIDGTGNSLANIIGGNTGSNILKGGIGNDTLDGGFEDTTSGDPGNDCLFGEAGDDFLRLAEYSDTLIGGEGKDTFGFQFADKNRDTLADFNASPGGDLLDFTSVLAGYTAGVSDPANFIQTVVVDGSTQINIDVDGPAGGIAYTLTAATLLGVSTDLAGLIANGAILLPGGAPAPTAPTIGTAAANNLTGDGVSNFIDGAAGNDTLGGGNGNDTLIGGAGIDKMDGGAGDDTFGVDNAKDIVIDAGGTFNDRIRTSISIDLSKYTGIEHATLTGKAALNLTGDGNANLLIGNDGNNILRGAAIDDAVDTLVGGAGADKYFVTGSDTDIVVEYAGGGVDEIIQLSGTYAMTAHVENLTMAAGSFAGNATGNNLANKITGNDGDNSLTGGGGNDLLAGGKGDDTLDGGIGADTMSGGADDDIYFVDDIGDKIVDTSGSDVVASTLSYTLASGLEALALLGGAALNGTGNAAANLIAGGTAANLLSGLAGDDSIGGGTDDDTLLGGDGNDTLNGQFNNDLLLGGGGKDRFVFDPALASADIIADLEVSHLGGDIIDLSALLVGATAGTLSGFVRVTVANGSTLIEVDKDGVGVGFDFEDAVTLTGIVTDGSGLMRGGFVEFGFDVGAAEIDIGTAGKDTFGTAFSGIGFGAAGNDSLSGGGGAETLDGGAGADTLRGFEGDDTYVVDSLLDVIIETGFADDNDMVRSSISIDLADDLRYGGIEHATLIGKTALKLTGDENNNLLIGNGGANIIDGKAGTDTLIGAGGNDIFNVSGGSDTVIEYAGGGIDLVNSLGNFTLGDQVENLTLIGFLNYKGTGNDLGNKITGNLSDNALSGLGGNDTLIGGEGNDNLDGGVGADILIGGNGHDSYVVDNAGDKIVEAAGAAGGGDAVFSFVDYTLGANVENLFQSGTDDIDGTGSAVGNILSGNDGNNILSGLGGNDSMRGGKGDDLLLGGDGIDRLNFSAGRDTLIGGAGADRFGGSAEGVNPADPADIIADFETGLGGDVVDLSGLFDEITSPDVLADPSAFISVSTFNGNTTISVDQDGTGGGGAFFAVCVLQGVSTDLNGLLSQGNLIPATSTLIEL